MSSILLSNIRFLWFLQSMFLKSFLNQRCGFYWQSLCRNMWPQFVYIAVSLDWTRQFSNHESRLLSGSHTFAIIVILDLKIHQSMWIHWLFFPKNLNQRSLTPRWSLTPCLLRSHVWLYPRIIVSKSHDNTSMYYSDQFCKIPHTYIWYYIVHTYYIHTTYSHRMWVSVQPQTHRNTNLTG